MNTVLPDLSDIQKRRRKFGLTQNALAFASQTSQSMIAKIESNKIIPSYDIAKRIFVALDAMEKKESVQVSSILTAHVAGVDKKDALSEAIRIMRTKNISQIAVFHGARIIGSISDQTITDLALKEDLKKIKKQSVEQFMEAPFPQVGEGTPLTVVTSLLHYNNAVIITKKDKIAGIVTKADLMKCI